MKNKGIVVDTVSGWNLLKRLDFIEIWKTPTKYLTCAHYEGIFIFANTYSEAIRNVDAVKSRL